MRKTPFVLGIIAMIIGGLTAFGSLIGLVLQMLFGENNPILDLVKAIPRRAGQPDPARMIGEMQAVLAETARWTIAFLTMRMLLSVALLIIGYGLYKRVDRARRAAMWWAGSALCGATAYTLFQLLVLLPKLRVVTDEYMAMAGPAASMARQIQATSQSIGVFVGALFTAAFPVVLLALLGRPSAKNDFVTGPAAP